MLYRHEKRYAIIFSALAFLLGSDIVANSQTRVSIGVTETIETANPTETASHSCTGSGARSPALSAPTITKKGTSKVV